MDIRDPGNFSDSLVAKWVTVDTPYKGAPPKRGSFFRLQVYKKVEISQVEVYRKVGNLSLFWLCFGIFFGLFSGNIVPLLHSKSSENGCSVLKGYLFIIIDILVKGLPFLSKWYTKG